MSHTPEPWEYYDAGSQVFADNGQRHVADVRGFGALSAAMGSEKACAIMDADGYLIAAAPDLLKACRCALTILAACPPTVRQLIEGGDEAIDAAGLNPWCINEGLATGDETHDVTWRLVAAIAKAEGK